MENIVRFERLGAVGVITLARPRSLNAIDEAMAAAIGDALTQLENDPDLRVGIITGSGRAFCAGADLKNLADGGSFYAPEHPEWGFAGITQRYIHKPLLAAVNGHALGGGLEIVLACDLAVMSSTATLGQPEVRHGLIAGAGGLLRLPNHMPTKLAAEMLLTGSPISAEQAARWGLVNSVVQPQAVVPETLRLAELIASNAPIAVAASKRMMAQRQDYGSDWSPEVWTVNDREFETVRSSHDFTEGTRAFTEKRQPQWSGN